jgi:hypothetical protein
MEHDFGMVLWPRFVKYVNICFGSPIRSNSLGEIKALQCTPQNQIDLVTAGLGQPCALVHHLKKRNETIPLHIILRSLLDLSFFFCSLEHLQEYPKHSQSRIFGKVGKKTISNNSQTHLPIF